MSSAGGRARHGRSTAQPVSTPFVAANELDMSAARDAGTSAGLLDRLLLTPERVEGMAAGLEKLAELPIPSVVYSITACFQAAWT